MKNNLKGLMVLTTLVGVSLASAYYDQYGNWHEDVVTEALDTVTGGRYSDQPQDTLARKKAGWERADKEKAAREKYQEKQQKIQRKKEERRIKNQ
jgi:hypothetical protein